eukprot:scaffold145_cov195-Alexandrium_tamarense.AAC.98
MDLTGRNAISASWRWPVVLTTLDSPLTAQSDAVIVSHYYLSTDRSTNTAENTYLHPSPVIVLYAGQYL